MKEMSKAERILALYEALMSGRSVNRREWAEEHGICERSVRRDLDAIRQYLDTRNDAGRQKTYILYSRKSGCHRAAHLEACELTAEEFRRIAAVLATSGMEEQEAASLLRRIFFAAVPEEEREKLTDWTERFLSDE